MANDYHSPGQHSAPPSQAPEPIVTLREGPAYQAKTEKERKKEERAAARRARNREKRNRPKKWYRAPLLLLVSLALVAGIVYGAGVYLFSVVCYPGTSIAGVDVSLMNRSTATSRISSAITNYKLTVSYEDFSWSYSPDSSDEILDAETAFDRVVDANEPLRWPVRLYEALTAEDTAEEVAEAAQELELPASFDTEAFVADVTDAVDDYNADRSGTFDKESAYDEEAGLFTVEEARANQILDADAVASAALVALSSLTRSVELDATYTVALAGGATDEELQAICDEANTIISSSIALTMAGTEVATITGEQFLEWLTMDESYQFSLDEEALADWASDLGDELDTVGTKRSFTRADGEKVVVSGGTYGWISNEAALCELIIEAVAALDFSDIEVPTRQEAEVYTALGEPDWTSYIDVDISEQYARYYDEDGEIIWEAGVITGNPNNETDTPTGVYYVVSKATDVTLLGELLEDGSYSYMSDVTYWMPFVGGSVGFHDATWQDEEDFGDPEAYLTVGSHGCVNLSLEDAAALYDLIEVGVCVIVHD